MTRLDQMQLTESEKRLVNRMLDAAIEVLDAEAYRDDILHEFLFPGANDEEYEEPDYDDR